MGAHHHFLPLRIRQCVRQKRPFPLQLARFRFTRTLGVFQCWIERTGRLRLNSGTISRIYGRSHYRMVVTELILTSSSNHGSPAYCYCKIKTTCVCSADRPVELSFSERSWQSRQSLHFGFGWPSDHPRENRVVRRTNIEIYTISRLITVEFQAAGVF